MATKKIDLITIKNDKLSLNIKGKRLCILITKRNFRRQIRLRLPAAADEFRPEPESKVDLLLGSLHSKKQLKYLLDNKLYYLPLQQSVLNYNLEYIAVFQSKAKFGIESGVRYYGRIKNKRIVNRAEIDFIKIDRNQRKSMRYQDICRHKYHNFKTDF